MRENELTMFPESHLIEFRPGEVQYFIFNHKTEKLDEP